MKLAAIAVILAILLIVGVAGVSSIKLAEANPFPPPITEITIEHPQNTYYKENTIVLFFSAKSVSFFPNSIFYYNLDGGERKLIVNRTTVSQEFLPINPGIYIKNITGNCTLDSLSEGWHNVTVYDIRHLNNNPEEREIIYSIDATFKIDTIAPKFSISSLENKTYYSHCVDLNFTTNDADSHVTYSLDGKENVTIVENKMITGLANGDHNVILTAMDKAGNTASQTIYFTIAEPFPTSAFAVVSIIVVAVVAGILIYFKRRRSEAL
jgi:hypothetical protein